MIILSTVKTLVFSFRFRTVFSLMTLCTAFATHWFILTSAESAYVAEPLAYVALDDPGLVLELLCEIVSITDFKSVSY